MASALWLSTLANSEHPGAAGWAKTLSSLARPFTQYPCILTLLSIQTIRQNNRDWQCGQFIPCALTLKSVLVTPPGAIPRLIARKQLCATSSGSLSSYRWIGRLMACLVFTTTIPTVAPSQKKWSYRSSIRSDGQSFAPVYCSGLRITPFAETPLASFSGTGAPPTPPSISPLALGECKRGGAKAGAKPCLPTLIIHLCTGIWSALHTSW